MQPELRIAATEVESHIPHCSIAAFLICMFRSQRSLGGIRINYVDSPGRDPFLADTHQRGVFV